ncbi:BMC domain-containing protein [Leclercia adecarboxylata]|uniref:BMC domain-containing protein n=1 Tax=Leclercia adecarboxylata TaxID=83655 RepID=A0AAP9DAJ0_9ENTR|nr:BMC domain-containing protein [Leclercia adecarboxylata]QDK17989.1 BMC domain-containing protein [Leclercia adecarboxylata]
MSGQSLGLIETVGMAAAVEAADAAMKSANVSLVGYELTKGGGMVTVKLEGEIGAINAAVAAAISAAGRVGSVYAHKVIARTAQHIEHIIHSTETVGIVRPEPETPAPAVTHQTEETPVQTIPLINIDTSNDASCMDLAEETPHDPVKKGPRPGPKKK